MYFDLTEDTGETSSWRVRWPEFPQCSHFPHCELQLGKEAIRLTRESGFFIHQAIWAAYRNEHHRMEHWVTLWPTLLSQYSSAINEVAELTGVWSQMQRDLKDQFCEVLHHQMHRVCWTVLAIDFRGGVPDTASSWCRARHFCDEQRPLRSRLEVQNAKKSGGDVLFL